MAFFFLSPDTSKCCHAHSHCVFFSLPTAALSPLAATSPLSQRPLSRKSTSSMDPFSSYCWVLICHCLSLHNHLYQQFLHHHPLSCSPPPQFSFSPDTFSRNSLRLFLTFLLSSKCLKNQLTSFSWQGGCRGSWARLGTRSSWLVVVAVPLSQHPALGTALTLSPLLALKQAQFLCAYLTWML